MSYITATALAEYLLAKGYVSDALEDTDASRLRSIAIEEWEGLVGVRPFVVGSETGHAAHQIVQQAIEERVAPERILLRLPSFVAAAVAAARTDAVATMPANLAQFIAADLKLEVFAPPLDLPAIEIGQYWHERYQRDPGHRWLREVTHAAFSA